MLGPIASYCEIPFVSATTLDGALTSSGSGKAALQKYRQEMRRQLDHGLRISVGRGGTVQLTSVPALACVATATRWNMHDALKLVEIYKDNGFDHLIQSDEYQQAMSLFGEAIKARVRTADANALKASVMDIIPECWEALTTESEVVRSVSESMHDIFLKVDRQAEEMTRWPGRLVRFEGENALVTIETGEREQLRTVNSDYLRAAGIHQNGAPFVLHEYRWSPDTTMSIFFPAFDFSYDAKAEAASMERLNHYAKPLPEPPVGLLPADFEPAKSQSDSRSEPDTEEVAAAASANLTPRLRVMAR